MKKQVVVIGGGETFDSDKEFLDFVLNDLKYDPDSVKTKNWKDNLQEDLGSNYQVLYPKMPNALNADYTAWSLYFDKVLAHVGDNAVFVGHSLGGLFLIKRFAEISYFSNWSPRATYFVATPFDNTNKKFASFSIDGTTVKTNSKPWGNINWLHSFDDKIVHPSDAVSGHSVMGGEVYWFRNRGHFIKDAHFYELVSLIRKAPWRE